MPGPTDEEEGRGMTLADERTGDTVTSHEGVGGSPVTRRPGRGLAHEALRERWFACSNALGWAVASEWPDPTVDEVCETVLAGHAGPALEVALTHWAGARASAGHRSRRDAVRPRRPAHRRERGAGRTGTAPTPLAAGDRRLAAGARRCRSDGPTSRAGTSREAAAVDPLSGLASARYLVTRLAEVHRAARAGGTRVPETHALVAVTLPVAGWSRVAPLAVAGDAASVVFDAGETIAVVGRSTVVVLAPREGLAGRVRVLRGLLARRLSGASGVTGAPGARIVALPATLAGAQDTLARLRAAEPPAPRRDRIIGLDVPATGQGRAGPDGPVPDGGSGLTDGPVPGPREAAGPDPG